MFREDLIENEFEDFKILAILGKYLQRITY